MKLRCSISSRKRFFALSFALIALFGIVGESCAQDRLVTKDGVARDGKILGVTGNSVMIQMGGASLGIQIAMISSVIKAAPPELALAQKTSEAGDYAKALPIAKAVADQYKGLPIAWAQQATSLVGDIYVGLGKLTEAEAAYTDFKKYYGAAGSVQTDVSMARIAVARKKYDEAKSKLDPIAEKALKEPVSTTEAGMAYSQTFFLLGQIAEAQGESAVALENYLRTVTLFAQDRSAVAAAQEKADALRKKNLTLVVP